jgi:hypothetical protein
MRKILMAVVLAALGCGEHEESTGGRPPGSNPWRSVIESMAATIPTQPIQTAGPTEAQKQQARDLCARFRNWYCVRIVDCLAALNPGAGFTRAEGVPQCEAGFAQDLDCSKVVQVGPTYSECTMYLERETCSELLPNRVPPPVVIPASCAGIFLLPPP